MIEATDEDNLVYLEPQETADLSGEKFYLEKAIVLSPANCEVVERWRRGRCSASCGGGTREAVRERRVVALASGARCQEQGEREVLLEECGTDPCPPGPGHTPCVSNLPQMKFQK